MLTRTDDKLRKVLNLFDINTRWIVFSATCNKKMINEVVNYGSKSNRQKKWIYIHTLMNNRVQG